MPRNKRIAQNIEGQQPDVGPDFGAENNTEKENEPLTEMEKQHNKKRKKNQ